MAAGAGTWSQFSVAPQSHRSSPSRHLPIPAGRGQAILASLEDGMPSLAGKTLFITGASRGIGLEIARRAARDGANIVIAAKTEVPHPVLPGTIHTAAAEIEEAGGH